MQTRQKWLLQRCHYMNKFSSILEDTARYASLLLAPAEGFGVRPWFFLPFGQKKNCLCCFGLYIHTMQLVDWMDLGVEWVKMAPNLLCTIFPMLALLKVLITHGRLSDQKIWRVIKCCRDVYWYLKLCELWTKCSKLPATYIIENPEYGRH